MASERTSQTSLQDLSDGTHQQRFLDPKVQEAWIRLVRKSAECGKFRLNGDIDERDLAEYTATWESWLIAARESFGPLPESDRPHMRKGSIAADSLDEAAWQAGLRSGATARESGATGERSHIAPDRAARSGGRSEAPPAQDGAAS